MGIASIRPVRSLTTSSSDAAAIRADFETWSGGFPPESVSQMHSYCEAARPKDSDYDEVFAILRAWMDEETGRS